MRRHGRDDWRARMALRGGPVRHTIARMGWLVFAGLGALAMVGVAVLYGTNAGEHGSDNSTATNIVAGIIVFSPIGAVVGALVGLPAQFMTRAWLRNPTAAERDAARRAEAEAAAKIPDHDLRLDGPWARSYEACARSVAAYHGVVATLPEGIGGDWLAGIGKTLDGELAEALRLARLGESLEPDDSAEPSETARRVLDRLRAAEKSFDETTERVAAIALDLQKDSDFVRVRAQLDVLARQAPQLRGTDAG